MIKAADARRVAEMAVLQVAARGAMARRKVRGGHPRANLKAVAAAKAKAPTLKK